MTDENEIETEELETEEVFEEIEEKAESPQETARAVWDELAAKAEAGPPKEGEAPPIEEKPNDISEAARKLASAKRGKKRQTFVPAPDGSEAPAAAGEAPAATTEKYEPPAAWTAADKEQFYKLDPLSQKNSLTWFKNAQAHSTRLWQEMNTEKSRAKEIAEVADEYIPKMKLPPGMTKGQVVKQLFEYQKAINEDDVGSIVEMMRHRKLTLHDLQARIQGQTEAPTRQAQQPQQSLLTPEEVDRRVEERLNQRFQTQAAESATEDVRKVQREMQNGSFVWPELHDAAYIQRIQPLISYFRGNNPDLGWGEVYKLAVKHDRQVRGVASPATPSPTSSRLTPETAQSIKQASSSLRSRGGNGAIPRMSEPKPNESARESAEAAYWEIFGNKQH